MLGRAASNAYSWWWASHVRTKQSKWLEENLQDIEEKVQYALKLLEDEGDSFAKRAEMYYKRRPELISFVEESFKAYRALAERYDHISKELQNANATFASVFPDQVPEFAMNEDDDDAPPHPNTSSNHNVPDLSSKPRKGHDVSSSIVFNKSGMSKTKAVKEIDKLQKQILALQTEKEFVKSSYENGLAKYWEIENCIMEKQCNVSSLQDQVNEGVVVVIEDEEAQVLMSTSALKSCQEKLQELRDKQENNVKETAQFLDDGNGIIEKFGSLEEKVNEEFDSCLTITDVADKIDELVNDVIDLERLFSSQEALIHRLREETNDLKAAQVRALQKETNSSQTDEIKEMEKKLRGIKDIDKQVEQQSENIEKHLTRAHIKLSFLSERLKSLKQEGEEEEVKETTNVSIQDAGSLIDPQFPEEKLDDSIGSENVMKPESEVVIAEKDHADENNQEETIETTEEEASSSPKPDIKTEDEAFLQQLLEHGIEGREKHLLIEHTKLLRNYKEVKKMLDETETKLKSENTFKDEQIQVLNHKLNVLLRGKSDGDDLQKLRAKDQQQKDQLFMLICREDNAISGQKQMISPKEQQFGARVDALLSENLNLLVKFSNSFCQIQQFDTGIKDLHADLSKIIEQNNQEKHSLRSNVRPIYKHLSEIRIELTIWLEKSLLLKEEINLRASNLNNIQNEITEALKTDSEDSESKFTIYQGAKFEGEASNMIKENNRIAEELQAGLDQVTKLQKEADKTLENLVEEFSLSESKNRSDIESSHDCNKTRIPLRSFIFDIKPKKQRLSIFSCIQPSLYKKMKPAL